MLEKGLDAGTAYEILSIDIADVDVGKNIGAELETDRAEADKKIAQAKAEERRAMAFAVEQEMRARVEEMRAKVVEAEATIPMAIAYAFKKGNFGIMDYYKMKNVLADTDMRDRIAKPEKSKRVNDEPHLSVNCRPDHPGLVLSPWRRDLYPVRYCGRGVDPPPACRRVKIRRPVENPPVEAKVAADSEGDP